MFLCFSPSTRRTVRPNSTQSSSPSSDSDEPDDSYVTMTKTSNLSFSAEESVRLLLLFLSMSESLLFKSSLNFILFVCEVSEVDAAPCVRGRSQQPDAVASQRQQTGGVPGPGPQHGTIHTHQTGTTSLHLTKRVLCSYIQPLEGAKAADTLSKDVTSLKFPIFYFIKHLWL